MCWPTVFAMLVISIFAVFLVFLAIAAFAHFFFDSPLATGIFNYLLRRKAGVIRVNGRSVLYTHKTKGGNEPSSLELTFKGNFSARAEFHTETRADRTGKEYGLNQEIQFNDPGFDEAVYIRCEDKAFIAAFLASPEAKDQLKTLLGLFTSFEIKGDRCVLKKTPCEDFEEVSMQELVSAAGTMLVLADRIVPPSTGQNTLTPLTDSARRVETILTAGSIVFVICGILLAFWGSESFEPVFPWRVFRASLYATVVLESIFISYVFMRVKGTSTGLRAFKKSLSFGGAGIILWCWGWLMVINGSQDASAAVRHEVNVLSKHVSSGKGSSFIVGLSSWSGEFEVYKLSLRRREFDLLEIGDTCSISVKKGFFGFDWIDGILCQGRGRYVGSGNTGGEYSENDWRFFGGLFRELQAPPLK